MFIYTVVLPHSSNQSIVKTTMHPVFVVYVCMSERGGGFSATITLLLLHTEACTLDGLLMLLGQKDYALGILPDHQEGNRDDELEAELEHELEAAGNIYTLAKVSIKIVMCYSD